MFDTVDDHIAHARTVESSPFLLALPSPLAPRAAPRRVEPFSSTALGFAYRGREAFALSRFRCTMARLPTSSFLDLENLADNRDRLYFLFSPRIQFADKPLVNSVVGDVCDCHVI